MLYWLHFLMEGEKIVVNNIPVVEMESYECFNIPYLKIGKAQERESYATIQ